MPFYERGPVRIHYEEAGSGFPLLLIPGGGPALCAKRPDVSIDMVHDFLTSMYTNRADFVFTVSRDFVRSIRTPLLIAPDDVPAHPYKVAMEVASLAPHAEVTIYPWKDSQEHIDQVVEHARRFLTAHESIRRRKGEGVSGRHGRYPLGGRWLRGLDMLNATRRRKPTGSTSADA